MQELIAFHYKEIDSTQKEIWRRISNNTIKNGTLICADKQTSGIGTHGRKWLSTQNNIAFSLYYELNCNIEKIEGITIEIANNITNILKQKYGVLVDIKQPNDLYVNGKKLGGILTETKINGDVVKFIVVGIGINNSQEQFKDELDDIKEIATSLKKEFKQEINVNEFIRYFCRDFKKLIIKRIEDEK